MSQITESECVACVNWLEALTKWMGRAHASAIEKKDEKTRDYLKEAKLRLDLMRDDRCVSEPLYKMAKKAIEEAIDEPTEQNVAWALMKTGIIASETAAICFHKWKPR